GFPAGGGRGLPVLGGVGVENADFGGGGAKNERGPGGGRKAGDVQRAGQGENCENRKLDLGFDTDPGSYKGGSSAATTRQNPQYTDDQFGEKILVQHAGRSQGGRGTFAF
ncbi:hypothetical protein KCA24_34545, partial [Escherichia coli]|nr:hypothetical protein [Escherichia coli]